MSVFAPDSVLSCVLNSIPDPRVSGRCKHKLFDILSIAICAVIAKADTFEEMEIFGREREDEFRQFLELPNGIPTHDTFNRVFQVLDKKALNALLTEHAQALRMTLEDKQIGLDGKKLKGVSPTTRGNHGLYILNAFVCEDKLCIGQESIETKSNEITAIPEILNQLDIKGAVVSADALNCQTEIAQAIIDKEGDYLLSVKGNQGSLHTEIKASFDAPTAFTESATSRSWEYDHGRYETRRCDILVASDHLSEKQLSRWANVSTLIRITATRDTKGKITESVRYYISSETDRNALSYNDLVRCRWGIENHLHWHLDVTFHEDACRSRTGNAPENLSTLRKFALQSLQQKKNKLSINKMRYTASLNFEYLLQIITI